MIICMNNSVEVLCLAPNQRRSYRRLNRNAATRLQPPLEDSTKQPIERVMLRIIFKIVFKTPMTLNSDYWGEIKFTGFRNITTSTVGTMGK